MSISKNAAAGLAYAVMHGLDVTAVDKRERVQFFEYVTGLEEVPKLIAPALTMNEKQRIGLERQLVLLCFLGNPVQAIKLYREHTGEGLIESKRYVDALREGLDMKDWRGKEIERETAMPVRRVP